MSNPHHHSHTQCSRQTTADGRTFKTELDAALHILWLIQRLSHENGSPADGPRFREAVLAARKLVNDLGYKPGSDKKPNRLLGIFCKKHIICRIPNPLWWIIGYGIIYPSRKIKRHWRKKHPVAKPPNLCGGCGKDDGDSLWGFCSPECLEIIHQKNIRREQADPAEA